MRKIVFLLWFLAAQINTSAQSPQADSTVNDTTRVAEQLLMQQQQQKIDDMLMSRLRNEMELIAGDNEKKKQLEQQIREIGLRDSARRAEQKNKVAILIRTAQAFPVVLHHDTMFSIYVRLGSFSAAERAAAVTGRIAHLYNDDFFKPDSLHMSKGDDGYDIVYGHDQVIMTITELDALFFDKTPETLGKQYTEAIRDTISKEKRDNSLINWGKRIGFVVLALAGMVLMVSGINRLFRRLSRYLILRKDQYFKGVTLKNYQLFSPAQHLRFSLKSLAVVRFAVILLAFYLSLPVLFSIFPQTEVYTFTLLRWVIDPAKALLGGIFGYLPKLFTILVVYFFTRYAIRGIRFLADEVERGDLKIAGFYSDWAQPTFSIVKFLLYAFMLIIIFPYLPGSGSPAFQGVSVFLGILFSLGSSSAIANIVAGLVITYMRPFRMGDRVKIGDITGDVLEKTLLVTRIRTIKNEEITVPNATVLSSHTTNYTRGAEGHGIIVHTTVTLGYDLPWKKVHEALIAAALRTELIENQPSPFVLQTSLQDFYVAYEVNAYTRAPEKLAIIYSQLHQNIQDCCNEAGIEILSPHYRAMRDGNASTLPEPYLSKENSSPSRSMNQGKAS